MPAPPRFTFVIHDELHDEVFSEHRLREDALSEVERLATLRWDEEPLLAPCRGWAGCGRNLELLTYDRATTPSRIVEREAAFEVDRSGVRWHLNFSPMRANGERW